MGAPAEVDAVTCRFCQGSALAVGLVLVSSGSSVGRAIVATDAAT